MSDQATPAVLRLNEGLGTLVEPAAWANNADLISARLGRERYGAHSASELHTWSEGGPTDYHAAALYTEAQMLDRVAAERERCAKIVDMPPGTEAWEVIGGEEGLTVLRELAAQIRSGGQP